MRELLVELLLRAIKPFLALLVGVVAWALAVGPAGATPSAELALLAFLAGGMVVLLVQEGPI